MSAITAEALSKSFRIGGRPHSSLKGRLLSGRVDERRGQNLFWALRNVSLEVKEGEFTGIIGSNGSGKSTLLKVLSGILYPDAGTVNIKGRMSSLLELGGGFHPELSGVENIYLNGSILGLSRRTINSRLEEIIDFSELGDFIYNPVRTYSSGMFVRLGFSVAICVEPDILAVDEVFAVGDEHFVRKCYEKIEALRKAGRTLVMVTHDLAAVEKWCDKAVWLHEGQLMEHGYPRYVIDKYRENVLAGENASGAAVQAERSSGVLSDTTGNRRWGDKSIVITGTKLCGIDGVERYIYDSEEGLDIRIDYRLDKPEKTGLDRVFGIALSRADGVHCYGTNTAIDSSSVGASKATGTVIFRIDRIGLLPADYYVDVAVHSVSGVPYDYWREALRFSVRSGMHDIGLFRLSHVWKEE